MKRSSKEVKEFLNRQSEDFEEFFGPSNKKKSMFCIINTGDGTTAMIVGSKAAVIRSITTNLSTSAEIREMVLQAVIMSFKINGGDAEMEKLDFIMGLIGKKSFFSNRLKELENFALEFCDKCHKKDCPAHPDAIEDTAKKLSSGKITIEDLLDQKKPCPN